MSGREGCFSMDLYYLTVNGIFEALTVEQIIGYKGEARVIYI